MEAVSSVGVGMGKKNSRTIDSCMVGTNLKVGGINLVVQKVLHMDPLNEL